MNKKILTFASVLALLSSLLLFNSCNSVSVPKGAKVVTNFDVNRYLGDWYEIARLDFKFEKDMNNTTANYTLNPDGSVKVKNRGFNYVKKEWKQAIGKAKFVGKKDVGQLKVSFFVPFYASYNIVEPDPNYQYALIIGKSSEYCWILSRTPSPAISNKNTSPLLKVST